MPLVPINAEATAIAGLVPLREALRDLPRSARVTVMIHGYSFAPGRGIHCPHRHILSFDPARGTRRALSWPRHLGLGAEHLGIGFGWPARRSLWSAWTEAERAGIALSRLLDLMAAEGRPVDIVAHSLGARVALAALRDAPPGALRRAILIAPAEFRAAAEDALDTPAGRRAEVVNVISRENDLFDALLEWLVAPHRPGARTLGEGLAEPRANWTDIQIDCPATLAALDPLGHRIAPPEGRVCHWSGYLRPGLFPLYRAILSGELPLERLRGALPRSKAPRWSRLIDRPALPLPLPLRRKAPL